jgi:hypothetical protein
MFRFDEKQMMEELNQSEAVQNHAQPTAMFPAPVCSFIFIPSR